MPVLLGCHASRVLLPLQSQLESGLVMPQDMEAVAAAVSGVLRDADLQVSKLSRGTVQLAGDEAAVTCSQPLQVAELA